MTPVPDPQPDVAAIFAKQSPPVRDGLLALRALIFAAAAQDNRIGPLTEALRWGQPAYLTLQTGAGCSLRIGAAPKEVPGGFGLFVHCRTSLIQDFMAGPGVGYRTSGTRAVLFSGPAEVRPNPLALLIHRALTWHLRPAPDRGTCR